MSAPMSPVEEPGQDRWAKWLLERRFGGDADAMRRALPTLYEFRDTVLRGACISPGDVVLDVGCGDGLLGIGALSAVGDAGQVVFSDISAPLLDRCAEAVAGLSAGSRCRFVRTGLPGLPEIATGSVDAAVVRSVLIYVADKQASFDALHRVLRPGGRLSIFEPINRFGHSGAQEQLWGFDVAGLAEIAAKVRAEYRRHQPGDDPMGNFDERDLLAFAEAAGFDELRLDYRVEAGRDPEPVTWERIMHSAPNPTLPTGGEVFDAALTPAEREALAAHIQRQIAEGGRRRRQATAYLTATRTAP